MSLRSLFINALQTIQHGKLTLHTPDNNTLIFDGEHKGPETTLTLHKWSVIDDIILRGDLGLAEAYMSGACQTDDLAALLDFSTTNANTLERYFHGKALHVLMYKLWHVVRPNTLRGSRKNIVAHYDLGNNFYTAWLDKSMTYSSALYHDQPDLPLEQAQHNKYQRILQQLPKKPMHCLEIGCGWGGFSKAAAMAGHRVTGLSLSPKQIDYCNEMIKQEDFQHCITIKNKDYRAEKGQYDNIVSIEMFEAVGQKYWPVYFDTIKRCLKHDGKAIIQVITIAESVFSEYIHRCDFIQKYIFPGGCLPSKQRFAETLTRAGLQVEDAFSFGQDYHRTLAEWLKRFDGCYETVKSMGYDDTFIRKWRFYLAYCMAGFNSQRTDVMQYTLTHAD